MFEPVPHFGLYPFNTFGMDVEAAYFSAIRKEEELLELKNQEAYKKGIFVLGGGSNILFTQNIDQWVIRNEIKGIEKIKEDDQHVWLKAGAGEVWHLFVLYCVDHNYGGVENLSLIPGTIGAAPMQNIGAYGVEVKDVIESVRFFNLETEAFETYSNEECQFGYRDSIFKSVLKGRIVITSVVFRLNKQPVFNTSYGNIQQELDAKGITELSIKAVSDAVISIRSSKLPDPKVIGNAGSFFKNPEITTEQFNALKQKYPDMPGYKINDTVTKVPAGWMIEQCGWKGFRENDYGVHQHQALVLVNYSKARGAQIAALSEKIIASVHDKFGINIEREVQIV
jgi:UDP-N-acetylmuramate dehydrogenase